MNLLITICARKGSKGLINKNLIEINNKSLIEITLSQANLLNANSSIVLSTDYKNLPYKISNSKKTYLLNRSKKLSNDKISKVDVIIDALKKSEKYFKKKFNFILDLDVTSPIRTKNDIKNCLEFINKRDFKNLITLKPSSKNPYFNMVEVKNKKCEIVKKKSKRFFSRQAAPKVFDMNASIYLWERSSLLKKDIITKKTNYYIMPEYCIDIDTKYDLLFIESVIRKIKFKHGL